MAKYPLRTELLDTPAIGVMAKEIPSRKRIPIYRLKFPDVDDLRKEAYRQASSLFAGCQIGDPRPEPVKHETRLVLQHPDGLRIRAYYASGYVEYRNLARTYAGHTDVTTLKQADSLVAGFAGKHALWPIDCDRQLQPDALRFVRSRGASREGKQTDATVNNAIVVYKRTTDGIQWIGPGSRITAMIEGRDVVGFNRHWRQVIPGATRKVTLLSVEKALESMVEDLSSRLGGNTIEAGDIVLERAEFGYYAAGKRRLQRFLQPVYAFFYRTSDKFSNAAYVYLRVAHEDKLEPLGRDRAQAMGQSRRAILTGKEVCNP